MNIGPGNVFYIFGLEKILVGRYRPVVIENLAKMYRDRGGALIKALDGVSSVSYTHLTLPTTERV